ncbi:MAG: hypothetical protein ACJ790_12060 [Myxococcaceae bacterium]
MIVMLMLGAGCATTYVTNSWTSPAVQAPEQRPKKTLVVALFPTEAARRTLEDNLSGRLGHEGVMAVPANRFFNDPSEINRDSLQQVAQREGFDSVVMSRFMGIHYGYYTSPSPTFGVGMGFGGYYGYAPYFGAGGNWYYPDQVYPQEEAVVQTSLFDTRNNGKLLWSATSKTVDPTQSEHEMGVIASKVVKRMQKDAVL